MDKAKEIVNHLLEFYQKLTNNGESAQLFMESIDKNQILTLKITLPSDSLSDTVHSIRPKNKKLEKTRKSPSTLRRDAQRKKDFLAKKESKTSFSTSTPTKPETRKNHQSLDLDLYSISREKNMQLCSLVNVELPCFLNTVYRDNNMENTGSLNSLSTSESSINETSITDPNPETFIPHPEISTNQSETLPEGWMEEMSDVAKIALESALETTFDKYCDKTFLDNKNIKSEDVDESVSFEDVKSWALMQKKNVIVVVGMKEE